MAAQLFIALIGLSLVVLPIYLIPAIIACARQHQHRHAITLVNVFMGVSGVGWFVALAWAFTAVQAAE